MANIPVYPRRLSRYPSRPVCRDVVARSPRPQAASDNAGHAFELPRQQVSGFQIQGIRRDAREAEGAPLLREYRVNSLIEGSNPSLSATYANGPDRGRLHMWRRERIWMRTLVRLIGRTADQHDEAARRAKAMDGLSATLAKAVGFQLRHLCRVARRAGPWLAGPPRNAVGPMDGLSMLLASCDGRLRSRGLQQTATETEDSARSRDFSQDHHFTVDAAPRHLHN